MTVTTTSNPPTGPAGTRADTHMSHPATGGFGRFASARTAGLLYLAIIVCGIFAEVGVRSQLVEHGDPSATAANILESSALFRAGIAADIVMVLCDVALAVVLYQLLRPISHTLSMMAAAFRMTQAAILGLNLLSMLQALRILDDAAYLDAFGSGQVESLALLSLDAHRYGYMFALMFFGVSTIIVGVLAWMSHRVPRILGSLLIVAGLGYLADGSMFFMIPGYDGSMSPIVLAPAFIAEVWFAAWLLTKGRTLENSTKRA